MVVQIQISDETWNRLKNKKVRPGQTFDEIVSQALDIHDEFKEDKNEN